MCMSVVLEIDVTEVRTFSSFDLCVEYCFFFFFSSRRRHTRCREVSWARRCVQETGINAEYMGGQTCCECRQVQSQMAKNQQLSIYSPMTSSKKWTAEEDSLLSDLVIIKYIQDWSAVTRIMNQSFPNTTRTSLECWARWQELLKTDKGGAQWEEKEILLLLTNHRRYNNNWSKISKNLPGRTSYSAKNKFKLLFQKVKDRISSGDSNDSTTLSLFQIKYFLTFIEKMRSNSIKASKKKNYFVKQSLAIPSKALQEFKEKLSEKETIAHYVDTMQNISGLDELVPESLPSHPTSTIYESEIMPKLDLFSPLNTQDSNFSIPKDASNFPLLPINFSPELSMPYQEEYILDRYKEIILPELFSPQAKDDSDHFFSCDSPFSFKNSSPTVQRDSSQLFSSFFK
eukprot:TRINITY_DN8018_c0_g1_i10.p1 TRINITY_DN8018_c0_g1~~TRINITY_DN8018_c0_g1_i10.p1  ORF type:complete len:400 (+),score=54.72 TRINITY_DN8018_c0_g1_i10:2-1201(+)